MALPVDAVVSGANLNDFGIAGENYSLSGLGLNTFGFLFPCDGFWTPTEKPITTTWTSYNQGLTTVDVCVDM